MTDVILTNPEEVASLAIVEAGPMASSAAVEGLQRLPVTNDDQCAFATQLLQELKGVQHSVEMRRTEISGPLYRAHRAVNELFRPALDALSRGEGVLKDKISEYLRAKEAANAAALQAAAAAPTPALAQQSIALVAPVAPPAGVSVRKVWRFRVVDQDKVPRELCSPDPEKIREAFEGGRREVPGVEFYQEDVVTARRAR